MTRARWWTSRSGWRLALGTARRYPHMLPWLTSYLESLRGDRSALDDGVPWITYRARRWLAGFLGPRSRVFEWGAGGSTIYLAQRAGSLVAIEHDGQWHRRVSKALEERGLAHRCELRHVPARDGRQPPADHQGGPYRSAREGYAGMDFSDYCRAVAVPAESEYDLIVVDGRARVGCILEARHHVASGGAILLDNSDRTEYASVGELLGSGWQRLPFPGPIAYLSVLGETTAWLRLARRSP